MADARARLRKHAVLATDGHDIAENSGYWDFIVLTWLPIYAVLYWGARF